jgi:glycosyltransferase involved in cell wall biosynthesis
VKDKKSLHICIFSRIVSAHGSLGGMEVHIDLISRGLAQLRNKVSILTTAHPNDYDIEDHEGVRTYFIRGTPSGRYRRAWWIKSIQTFHKLHSSEPVNLVLSESAGGEAYASLSSQSYQSIPLVTVMHGTFADEIRTKWQLFLQGEWNNLSLGRIPFIYYRYLAWRKHIERANAIISVSHELADTIVQQYAISPSRIHVIPNGVNTQQFQPMPEERRKLRNDLGLSENSRLLLFVGRLEREKGGEIALLAFQQILKECSQDVRLLILGEGKYRYEMENIASKLGLGWKVSFCGYVPQKELSRYYAAGDVLLFPTIRLEGLPFVILEALSSGIPIVASRIGGIPTAIEDGQDGLLIRPGDSDALARKTLRILKDNQLATQLSTQSRKKAVHGFSQDQMVEDTIQVFEQCLRYKKAK